MIGNIIQKYIKKLLPIFITLCVIGNTNPILLITQANHQINRVLFISSYSQSFRTVPEQIEGIQSTLEGNSIELDFEYMDARRFDNPEKRAQFYTSLKYNIENHPTYDAIIIGDDSALDFAVEHQDELFPETPIVFLGINDIEWAIDVAEDPYITGIIEETSIAENIELATDFNPNATKVVGIVDNTLTGQGDAAQFELVEEQFPELDFELINFSDYTYEEFPSVIEAINEDTLLSLDFIIL